MPLITRIAEQKRRPNRRNVYLDGGFAFGCNVNVIARFRLREGLLLTAEQVLEIELGEVKQECFDRAISAIQSRLHSRAEIRRKLMRREYGEKVVNAVIEDLVRLGYIDDKQFAKAKVEQAATFKRQGRRRASIDLMKAGVKGEAAEQALNRVYDRERSDAIALELATKKAPHLLRLGPIVARRRMAGLLARRGFDPDTITSVLAKTLGKAAFEDADDA